ncbi:hypothetical protein H0H81_000860 [Sphagnurus paluster]|uniref:Uncharacterized protein n=1 Tax=Sphagnurus paluster TaxID=117069 RepID=A0A9P7GP07_9AGAR|nr:hypothetical protein H0H81_000860 [Sphagnurus paluster]
MPFLSVTTGLDDGLPAVKNFFQDVLRRSPQIEHLEFCSYIPFNDIAQTLSSFLVGLQNLRTIHLYEGLLASSVITALSKCRLLEFIHMTKIEETDPVPENAYKDLLNYIPSMDFGAFASLRGIDVKAHLWNVASFLQSEFPAARLRRIVVMTLMVEDNMSVQTFYSVVAETCPLIEFLDLQVIYDVAFDESERLPLTALKPLFSCTSLATFNLSTPIPLDFDDSDVLILASSWRHIRELNLNPRPMVYQPEGKHPTLSAMLHFAKYCPQLVSLGLYIDTSSIPAPSGRQAIPKLESLRLGLAGTTYKSEELALFLADVTPLSCSISGFHDTTTRAKINIAIAKWTKVGNLLPILRNVHAQYQARLKPLEAELHRLSASARTNRHTTVSGERYGFASFPTSIL